MATAFKTSDGAVFVQTSGPNTKAEFVGCVDVDTLTEPGGAIDTLIRCFKPDGTGWNVIGSTITPADPVTTTITTYVESIQNAFERMRQGQSTMFIHQRDGGQAGSFGNYIRTWVLGGIRVGEKTAMDLVHHDTDTVSTMAFGISAFPPIYRVFQRNVSRRTVAETMNLTDISFCGSGDELGKIGVISAVNNGAATPNVLYSSDYGVNFIATAADPLAVSEKIASIVCFPVSRNTTRILAALGTTRAGGPMVVAYSDDLGVTWTTVTVGATNGQFAEGPSSLFMFDSDVGWLVTSGGYIYHTTDGGLTWTVQDAGVALGGDGHAIHFITDRVGIVGGAAGKIATTQDGGQSWTLVTVPAASVVNTVWIIDSDHLWAGCANGNLYYSDNAGLTWNLRVHPGSGAGAVKSIAFAPLSALMGTMVRDTAGPVGTVLTTIDGGYTWEPWTTPTNTGLNGIYVLDENVTWIVGNAQGGTGVVLKTSPKQ